MADMALRSRREPPPISACKGRVGVFRALHLGDMLCAIPALRALRNHCPSAHITLIGLPWAREIATRFPEYIDDFLPFSGHPQLPERPASETEYRQFVDSFPTDFEWLIQLHGDGHVTNGLLEEWAADFRAGFVPQGQPAPSAFWCHYPDGHEIDRLLRMMSVLGASGSSRLAFPVSAEDFRALEGIPELRTVSDSPYVVVHVGSRGPDRRLPIQFFAEVAKFLADRARVVFTGTSEECDLTRSLAQSIPRAVDAAGLTTLGMLAALLSRARLVVTNDSGPSHLCAALDVPSLVIVSGSDPVRWGPKNRVRHRLLDARSGSSLNTIVHAVADLWSSLESL